MLGLTFSSKLDWGSYIISIAETASKKIEALISSMKFLSSKVAVYLYKSTTWSCIEYCCHVLAGACGCYLELLEKLQKWICSTVGPSTVEPLVHHWNVASLKLVSAIFIKFLFFHQMIALQKLWKNFISSKKLFAFSRYSNFYVSVLPSFSASRPFL